MKHFIAVFFSVFSLTVCMGQGKILGKTNIRGFMDINSQYDFDHEKLQFGLGEQDLFITSDLSDKISFLGETVFKYNSASATKFSISLERAIFKYNYWGNHNFFAGKVHTALNYWNDTYHHGRLFFPTVGRPEIFNQGLIPIHTLGLGLSGQDLGKLNFGYTAMIGNGIGATEVSDNDIFKSVTLAAYIKPINKLRIGGSFYYDVISDGEDHSHGTPTQQVNHDVTQFQYSGSVAYFGKHFEILTEGLLATNTTDSLGTRQTLGGYFYAGYRYKDMLVPYVRMDYIGFEDGEMYFAGAKTNAYAVGLRWEANYLTSLKLEYQYKMIGGPDFTNNIFFQIALGF